LPDSEADALNFFAAAVRARSTPARDPVRVFVALVRGRHWDHVTQAQENEARRMLQPQRGVGTASSVVPGPVRGILDGLVAALTGTRRSID
jgi:hypothetical protein